MVQQWIYWANGELWDKTQARQDPGERLRTESIRK